ncbi:DUF3307 domain-containing protein [Pseudomonas lopnurensis]|uniref:DUF3307 domain-containing protein n=1 Tax=Pseudomonas lopnurensis TaxID=1477517 RepID=UPI0028A64EE0|nr:DUF3307 domain-containing protein [Pseudomonas lopnurensis]
MPDSITLLLWLLLAHVALDFLLPLRRRLQDAPSSWRSPELYLLGLAQGLAVLLILGVLRSDPAPAGLAALLVVLIRILVAGWAAGPQRSARSFLLEQLAALLTLVALWLTREGLWQAVPAYLGAQADTRNLLILLGYLLVLAPASGLIGAMLRPWQERIGSDDSLVNGGAFVGYLERGLILTLVLLAQWQAIGFLLTAKSILRFNELKGRNNRQRSEYVLLGTLLSFTLSIAVGLAIRLMLGL